MTTFATEIWNHYDKPSNIATPHTIDNLQFMHTPERADGFSVRWNRALFLDGRRQSRALRTDGHHRKRHLPAEL